MLKKSIKILLVLTTGSFAQEPCLRYERTFTGQIITHEYSTAYYVDADTFDFPVRKVWRVQSGDKVWTLSGGLTDEKVVIQPNREFAPPDTLRFERYVKASDKKTVWQLTRFFGNIYQVWKISHTSYAWAGQHTTLLIPVEVRTFERTFVGWPDNYMSVVAYKTDEAKILARIEKYRCKDKDAGRRKAGVN